MSHSYQRLVRVLWFLAAACVIVGELLPGDSLPLKGLERLHIPDKAEHFSGYLLLAFLPAISERLKVAVIAGGGAVLMGVLLEFAQRLTPTRQFEIADMVANTLGVMVGLALGLLVKSRLR